jgi:NADPH:quinone reductase-like Zn-dependent oxidoreductase
MKEILKPNQRDDEVLVKVHANTVTIGDCRMRSFTVPPEQWLFARLYLGIFRPRRPILGMELAGKITLINRFNHPGR